MDRAYLRPVTEDVFGIAGRLRSVDPGYYIVYNMLKGRFEVHHTGQGASSLALAVPYPELDARTERLVRESRREYADNVLKDMDRQNERLQARSLRRAAAEAGEILEEMRT